MSFYLRILLIVFAVGFCIYVIRKIRKAQMKIEGAIYWIFLVSMLLLLSIFPDIGIHLANIIGIESPVNFIYLVIIFMALEKIFSLSVKSSQLEYQISILTAEIAIWRNQMEQEGKK
jgi:hypothetical protein